MSTSLSKSKLMRGFQCHKNLWLHLNRPELEGESDKSTQMQFDEGNEVGELARKNFGPGLLIDNPYWEFEESHKRTQAEIERINRKNIGTIYEAAFLVDGLYARADILHRDKEGWHLIEVKKSTSVKDYQVQDSGVQAFIIAKLGLKLSTVSIMHISSECIYPDLKNLFSVVDITELVQESQILIKETVSELQKIVSSKSVPKIKIGPHCDEPFECPFCGHCWKKVPKNSVFDLPALSGDKKWKLFNSGKIAIQDLDPADFKNRTKRAIEVVQTGKPFVNRATIKEAMNDWKFPMHFFDFETINPAIPRYKGTNPYGQVPFQFSCHVWQSKDSSELVHYGYLQNVPGDPRQRLTETMLEALGTEGSIVAYNKTFEIRVIKGLAESDSKNRNALVALVDRFVDPLPNIRANVYYPEFAGSFSIKAVAPAMLGKELSYENMEIGDGGTAQVWAEQILQGKITEGPEKEQILQSLMAYCRQDTLAMVELVRWMANT